MIEGKKQTMDKLHEMSQRFKFHMERKEYCRAKALYDAARTAAVFMELGEVQMIELFGERGERGEVISVGLFPEVDVQKAYIECIKHNQTSENKRYPGMPRPRAESW
jgi:hypothetical protein